MGLVIYQALLSNPDNIRRLQTARRLVERVGGRLEIGAPNNVGMVLVLLWLPAEMTPDHVLPGIPFYPV